MDEWHVVSFSGGKDSTAMLLRMLELNMRVDEIIFCDTGVEFPQMYDHLDKVERYIGRQITRLKAEHDFEFFMFRYRPKRRRNNSVSKYHEVGLSWPLARGRWCTRRLKADIADRYAKTKAKESTLIQYVGIAADESHRAKEKRYPLIEWNWTEKDALDYCYNKGFDWGGLYEIFGRVSCWCCPLQPLDSCRKLRRYFPQLWEKLRRWDNSTWQTFKPGWTVDALEERFAREDEWEKMQICLF